jgi:hypothetical protein
VLAPGRVDLEPFYGLAVALLAGAIVAAACTWLARLGPSKVALGGLSWFLVLAGVTSFALPGTSYLFFWPLVWALAGVGVAAVVERRGAPPAAGVVAILTGAAPGVALLAPATWMVFASFGASDVGAPVVAALTALTLLLVAPFFALVAQWRAWAAPGLLVVLAVAAVAAGAARATYGDANPQPTNVAYGLDADTGEAVWASYEARPSAWTAAFHSDAMRREPLPGFFPRRGAQPALVSPAPGVPLSGPVVELLGEAPYEGGRVLRLRAASTRGARVLALSVPGAKVVAATANGREVAPSMATVWSFTYLAPPATGVEVELRVEGTEQVEVRAIDATDGLPTSGAVTPRQRPAATVPIQSGDQTLVARSFRF